MPLQPILVDALFTQWGLDVIGPNNSKPSQRHAYLLNAIDYSIKWKEVRDLKKSDTNEWISLIEENIISKFGVLEKIITNNGTIFIDTKFTSFCKKYGITMGKSLNYYPQ